MILSNMTDFYEWLSHIFWENRCVPSMKFYYRKSLFKNIFWQNLFYIVNVIFTPHGVHHVGQNRRQNYCNENILPSRRFEYYGMYVGKTIFRD